LCLFQDENCEILNILFCLFILFYVLLTRNKEKEWVVERKEKQQPPKSSKIEQVSSGNLPSNNHKFQFKPIKSRNNHSSSYGKSVMASGLSRTHLTSKNRSEKVLQSRKKPALSSSSHQHYQLYRGNIHHKKVMSVSPVVESPPETTNTISSETTQSGQTITTSSSTNAECSMPPAALNYNFIDEDSTNVSSTDKTVTTTTTTTDCNHLDDLQIIKHIYTTSQKNVSRKNHFERGLVSI
jgi:hypothetical protein